MNAVRDIAFPVFATVAFAAMFVFIGTAPSPSVDSPPEWDFAAPPSGWKYEDVRYCQNEQCGRAYAMSELGGATSCPSCGSALAHAHVGELTVLPPDTRISRRRYSSSLGWFAEVAVIVGGTSKRSIHRPELCLPAQGFVLDTPRDISAAGRPWHLMALRRNGVAEFRSSLKIETGAFAYTFFNQKGLRTASHLRRIFADVWDRSVLNRIDRWAMVTVNASRSDDMGLSYLLSRLELDGGDAK